MKKVSAIMFIYIFVYYSVFACSSAIISGRVTPDGRSLLWKHRDAREMENNLRYFKGKKYDFIGIINTEDIEGSQVWMGSNSAGFSILDTNAYNLVEREKYSDLMDKEGFFMKEALGKCSTLNDFERMLDETNGKRGTQANFGLIDAQGGAAYYEVSPDSYEKFDVNDPKTAPSGYLIRTNFAFSGATGMGSGYIRYQTLEEIFHWNRVNKNLSLEFLLFDATRCLKHSVLKTDLYTMDLPENKKQTCLIPFRDYIVGFRSVSTMVIQGVKPGEDPNLTTLWTIPSFQLTSLTVPVWVSAGEQLPKVVLSKNDETALIAEKALICKQNCFPIKTWDGSGYLDVSAILNKEGNGILQKLIPQDKIIVRRTNELLAKWRKDGFNEKEAVNHYNWLDDFITEFYKELSDVYK